MAELGEANIGGRMVPAWLLNLTAEELEGLKEYSKRYSNPNLLDNPWFTVNQRGKSEYTPDDGSNKYTVDRWKSHWGQKVVVNGYGQGVTCSLANNFCQFIDHDLSESLRGKEVTLSVKLIDGSIYSATATIPMVSQIGDEFASITLTGGGYPGLSGSCVVNLKHGYSGFYTDGFMVTLYGGDSGPCTWVAAKLELGSVSTLANDSPPDYATELAKCRRYFYRIKGGGGSYLTPIVDVWTYANGIIKLGTIIFPVDMASVPTVSCSALSDLSAMVGGRDQGDISYFGYSSVGYPDRGVLQFDTSAAANEGLSGMAYIASHGHVDFSADL